jgi:hypothetical protein
VVPSTVASPALIHSYIFRPQSATATSSTDTFQRVLLKPQPVSEPAVNNFIHILQNLVKDLPESIPEASEFDKLAVFRRSPKEFDDPTLDADDLWEASLNHVLSKSPSPEVVDVAEETNVDDEDMRGDGETKGPSTSPSLDSEVDKDAEKTDDSDEDLESGDFGRERNDVNSVCDKERGWRRLRENG